MTYLTIKRPHFICDGSYFQHDATDTLWGWYFLLIVMLYQGAVGGGVNLGHNGRRSFSTGQTTDSYFVTEYTSYSKFRIRLEKSSW